MMSKSTLRHTSLHALACVVLLALLPGTVCAENGSMRIELELLPVDSRLPRGQLLRSLPHNQIVQLRRVVADPRPVSRRRNSELSEGQLLVVAYDSQGQELARTLVPDSRLVRAETLDASGVLIGEKLFRQKAELTIHLPNIPGMTTLKIFQPRWNGAEFALEPLNDILLP